MNVTSFDPVGQMLPPPAIPVMEVTKLNLWGLFFMFLGAVGLHTIIGVYLSKAKKELADIPKGGEVPKELFDRMKILNLLFRWYPAGAVVVMILFLSF